MSKLSESYLRKAAEAEAGGSIQYRDFYLQKAIEAEGRSPRKSKGATMPRTKKGKRHFGGHEATSQWMCESCGFIAKSKLAVERHEAKKHRRGADFLALTVKPHRARTAKCKWCGRMHAHSQHASHGIGSFHRTHG